MTKARVAVEFEGVGFCGCLLGFIIGTVGGVGCFGVDVEDCGTACGEEVGAARVAFFNKVGMVVGDGVGADVVAVSLFTLAFP